MLKVKINQSYNFTPSELKTLYRCKDKLEMIVNHDKFKELFMKADFHGELSIWGSVNRERLWEHFVSGAEELDKTKDYEIDVSITIFNPRFRTRNVVGYTYGSTAMTWINRKFFNWYGDKTICSNIIHEWGHKIGMDHDFKATARRPYSVCYQLNNICEEVYDLLFDDKAEKVLNS